jgi:hypothetical protein
MYVRPFSLVFRSPALRRARPACSVAPADEEALETQIIENIRSADVHPVEEAQGFRALLEREGAGYTVEKIAAKTGNGCACIAKRLRLLDLTPPVADAFTAGRIGIVKRFPRMPECPKELPCTAPDRRCLTDEGERLIPRQASGLRPSASR